MKCSVIYTTYNNEKVIPKSLEALLRQTLPADDFEVIAIDDCSSDNSFECIVQFQANFSITLLRNETNRGSAYSRNRAVQKAKASLLVFIQDDIIIEDDFLKIHCDAHEALHDNKSIVVGFTYWHQDVKMTGFMRYLDNGQQFEYAKYSETKPDENDLIQADRFLFYTSNLSIKKIFFDEVRGFDEKFMMPGIAAYDDTELAWRLQKKGMKLWYAPKARAAHLHQRSLESLIKRRYAEGFLSHKLKQKHPDFSWTDTRVYLGYNLHQLKVGVLFSRFRALLIIMTTLLINPLVNFFLEKVAYRLQEKHMIPLLYKAVLGFHFNRGYWDGVKNNRKTQ